MTRYRFGIFGTVLALAAFASLMPRPAAADDLSADYKWRAVKIGAGGFVRGMAVHPTDPNVRFARADVDNVYRWDTARQRWVAAKIASAFNSQITGAPANGGPGAIAIDPNNSSIVLVAYNFTRSSDVANTNPSIALNVYRSTDGGKNFKPGNLNLGGNLSQETRGERLAIDPHNSNLVYFGSPQNGLWRSLDGGVHFENVTAGGAPAATADVALPRFDAGCGNAKLLGNTVSKCVYLTLTGGSILRSRDGGNTWASISSGQPVDGSPGFTTIDQNGRLWTTDGASGNLYRYTRGGVWSTIATPISGITGIAVDPANANRVFIINGGGQLARSTNGGRSWTDLGGVTFSETQKIEWLRPSEIRPQQHYFSNGGIYFDAKGNLWSPGGNDAVINTTPNDATDTAANPPVWSTPTGIEELVATNSIYPPGGRPVLAADDETLFVINDPSKYNATHYPIDLWGYNPLLGYNNNGLSSAQDITYLPNQPQFLAVASDNFFAGDPQKQQFSGYSDDGGYTWNLFPSIIYGRNPCILYGGAIAVSARAKGSEGSASGNDTIVRLPTSNFQFGPVAPAPFYSKDGGNTWAQTTSFDSVADPNNGSSTKQTPCETGTYGSSFTYMPRFWGNWVGALVEHPIAADPVTPGTFYLLLGAGGFWRSTDGGATWSQTTGSAQLPSRIFHGKLYAEPGKHGKLWVVDGREGADYHGLFSSTDGGSSFVRNKNFDFAWALALGKAAPGSNNATIYVYGLLTGDANWGIFQSTDNGKTFNRISYYPAGLFDYPTTLTASWDDFGVVYIGFVGNSYAYSTYTPQR